MTDRFADLEREVARLLRALQQLQIIETRRAELLGSDDETPLEGLAAEADAALDDIKKIDGDVRERYAALVKDASDPGLARLRKLDGMVREMSSRLADICAANEKRVQEEMVRMVERIDRLQTGREAMRRYEAGADAGSEMPTRDREKT